MSSTPNAPKKKSSAGLIAVLVLLVACPLSIAIIGILSAIAIPAFVGYMRRAKEAEATSNLAEIARHMEAYRAEFGTYPTAPATPLSPPCGTREMFTPDSAWEQIGFAPADPIRYSYEAQGTRESYVIRARGDLDCDGIVSLYERSSESASVRVENEHE